MCFFKLDLTTKQSNYLKQFLVKTNKENIFDKFLTLHELNLKFETNIGSQFYIKNGN